MPTYAYRCKHCSHQFEKLQKITDHALITCPECKEDGLVRIIHGGAGMVFKGSGFYLTDYKKSGTSQSGSGGSAVKQAKGDNPSSGNNTGGTSGSSASKDTGSTSSSGGTSASS